MANDNISNQSFSTRSISPLSGPKDSEEEEFSLESKTPFIWLCLNKEAEHEIFERDILFNYENKKKLNLYLDSWTCQYDEWYYQWDNPKIKIKNREVFVISHQIVWILKKSPWEWTQWNRQNLALSREE